MNKLLLIGSGGHASACIDVIEAQNQFKIGGLIEKPGHKLISNCGYDIIGSDKDLKKLREKFKYALVSVGQLKSPSTRIMLYELLKKYDYTSPKIISPYAYVSKHASVGEGSIVMHGAIVNANSVIGKNCIINNKALIEHDATVNNFCHISTGSIINGGVTVGQETFVGSGAITKQYISIGEKCIIGAGIFVKENIKPNRVIKF
tara:strand:- start:350 stop:961 length:612 start_codon:yes stop_codon:yes gene_type:complete